MLRFRDFDTNLERPILCWVQTLDDSGVEVTCEVEPLRFRDFDTTLVGRLLFCCVQTLDDNPADSLKRCHSCLWMFWLFKIYYSQTPNLVYTSTPKVAQSV